MSDDTVKEEGCTMRFKVVSEVRRLKQDRPGGWINVYAADVEAEDGKRLVIYLNGTVTTETKRHVKSGEFINVELRVVEREDGSKCLFAETVEGVGI